MLLSFLVYLDVAGKSSTDLHVFINTILPKPFGHIDESTGDYIMQVSLYGNH